MKIVKIDDKSYNLDEMNMEHKAQIAALRSADARLAELRRDVALVTTARNLYQSVLKKSLSDLTPLAESEIPKSDKVKAKVKKS